MTAPLTPDADDLPRRLREALEWTVSALTASTRYEVPYKAHEALEQALASLQLAEAVVTSEQLRLVAIAPSIPGQLELVDDCPF